MKSLGITNNPLNVLLGSNLGFNRHETGIIQAAITFLDLATLQTEWKDAIDTSSILFKYSNKYSLQFPLQFGILNLMHAKVHILTLDLDFFTDVLVSLNEEWPKQENSQLLITLVYKLAKLVTNYVENKENRHSLKIVNASNPLRLNSFYHIFSSLVSVILVLSFIQLEFGPEDKIIKRYLKIKIIRLKKYLETFCTKFNKAGLQTVEMVDQSSATEIFTIDGLLQAAGSDSLDPMDLMCSTRELNYGPVGIDNLRKFSDFIPIELKNITEKQLFEMIKDGKLLEILNGISLTESVE